MVQPKPARSSQSVAKASFEYGKCWCMPKFHIARHRKIERRRTRDGCSGASSMCVPSVGGVLADCGPGGATAPPPVPLLLLRLHPEGRPVQKRSRLQRPCSSGHHRPAAEFRLRHRAPACTGEFLRMQQQQQQQHEESQQQPAEQGRMGSSATYAADFDLGSTLLS